MMSTVFLRCITVPFATLLLKHNAHGKVQKDKIRLLKDKMDSPHTSDADKLQAALEVQTVFKVSFSCMSE
jgi:hypothetical protein